MYIHERTVVQLTDADWNFTMTPINPAEQNLFDSWIAIFNIVQRYQRLFST